MSIWKTMIFLIYWHSYSLRENSHFYESIYIRNVIFLSRAKVAKFLNKLKVAARYSFFAIGLDGFDAACKIECFNFTGYLLFGCKRKLRRNTESIGRVPTRGVFTVRTKSETADYLRIGSRPTTSHSRQFKVHALHAHLLHAHLLLFF